MLDGFLGLWYRERLSFLLRVMLVTQTDRATAVGESSSGGV